uniref:ubiquitinyl hydrolase 1 n=1 Tax=Panagrellus redivivus TaxID=6233 RepID=A0A7E4VYC1_PANRE
MGSNYIYFEKQDADLMCGQHALNNLVQENAFTVDMIAEANARIEANEMALGIVNGGQNASLSGDLSIQVLQALTESYGIRLVNFSNPQYLAQACDPVNSRAFLVNKSAHWFVLRRFGPYWFILNSLSAGPVHISNDRFISEMQELALQQQRNSAQIFHVIGDLPECEADRAAKAGILYPERMVTNDAELKAIIESSTNAEADELDRVLELSRQEAEQKGRTLQEGAESAPAQQLSNEEIRQIRIQRFSRST